MHFSCKPRLRSAATAKLLLMLSGSMIVAAGTAHAQQAPADAGTGLNEIVVTAQKRSENLQSVPLAISALGTDALQKRGVSGLDNLRTAGLPGVQINMFGGQPHVVEVQVRGATTSSSNDAGRESSTAIYVDDVYQPRAHGMALTLADPVRIELLRGPQGQLFGRGADGGAMRIVTGDPTGKLEGRISGQLGNYNARKGEIHLNLPEFANFAIKLDGIIDQHDGYTKNPANANIAPAGQHDFNEKDDKGFRVGVKWTPSSDVRINYAYSYLKSFVTSDYSQSIARPAFVPSFPIPATAQNTALYPYTSAPIWRGVVPIQPNRRMDTAFAGSYQAGFRSRIHLHSLRAEYDASDSLTIRSITGYNLTKVAGLTQDGGNIIGPTSVGAFDVVNLVPHAEAITGVAPGARIYAIQGSMAYNTLRSEFFSQELQLVGNLERHKWVAGLYYSNETIDQGNGSPLDMVYFDPNNTGSANLVRNYATYAFVNPFYTSAAAKLGINTHENSRSFAIFAQDTFTPAGFDDKLHLTLGMRYTDDNKGGVRVTDTVAGASGLALKEIATKRFDPAATIGYDLTDLNQVYLRYSRAYKAGGYNLTSSAVGTPPAVISFGNEQNQSIEIGSKNEFFDRKVRLNVAAFYSMLKNLQMNVFKVPDGAPVGTTPQSFTINAPGTTKTYGVEVELNAVVAPGLTVGVNYAYLHQKIPTITPAIDPAVVANGTTVLTPAIYFPSNAPRHSISGSIDYETSVGIGTAYLHLDGAYTSMFNTTNRQGENLYLVPRRLAAINGRVGIREIELGMGKLNLSVYANNLTNTQQVATTSGRSDVFWMPPRTYGVQATVSF